MDLLIAATPHAHVTRPCSRNPADFAGLDEQLAVVKVRTISPPDPDRDTAHAAEWGRQGHLDLTVPVAPGWLPGGLWRARRCREGTPGFEEVGRVRTFHDYSRPAGDDGGWYPARARRGDAAGQRPVGMRRHLAAGRPH